MRTHDERLGISGGRSGIDHDLYVADLFPVRLEPLLMEPVSQVRQGPFDVKCRPFQLPRVANVMRPAGDCLHVVPELPGEFDLLRCDGWQRTRMRAARNGGHPEDPGDRDPR